MRVTFTGTSTNVVVLRFSAWACFLTSMGRPDLIDLTLFGFPAMLRMPRDTAKGESVLSRADSESASVMTRKCGHNGVTAVTVSVSESESSLVRLKGLGAIIGLKVFLHVGVRPPH